VFCTRCGVANDDGARHCAICGERLAPPVHGGAQKIRTDQNGQPIPVVGTIFAEPSRQYAPMPPTRPRPGSIRRNGKIIVAAVALVIVLVIAALAIDIGDNSSSDASGNNSDNRANTIGNAVSINGMDIFFDYTGTTSGYFGPTSQSSSSNYDTTTGQTFTETVTITNSALLSSHSVTGISVASPFTLESISPSQFNQISPAGTVIYTLTITAPPTSGDYILSITVTTGSADSDNVVAIQGSDMAIKYNNTNDDFFGPSTQSQTWYLNTSVGDKFSETITLSNYDELSSHSVSEISVASPFSLDSVSPSLPESISPGGSVTYSLTITAPSVGGDYMLSDTITTGASTTSNVSNGTQLNSGNYTVSYSWTYPYYSSNVWRLNVTIPATTYSYYADEPKTYDYASYVTKNDAIIDQIAELLKSDAENNSYDTAQFVLSFVQNVPYGTDENTTGTMNFPRYPVETLVDHVGDCKDHSALYASLMGAPSIDAGVVLIDLQKSGVAIGHMMVGLCLTGYDGLYVPYGGRDYFLCETTAPGWLIGQESPQLEGYTIQVLST